MKRLVNHKFNVRDMLYPLFYVTPFFSVSTLELKLSVLCLIMPLDKARPSQKKRHRGFTFLAYVTTILHLFEFTLFHGIFPRHNLLPGMLIGMKLTIIEDLELSWSCDVIADP
jgi:hypothetical protein